MDSKICRCRLMH